MRQATAHEKVWGVLASTDLGIPTLSVNQDYVIMKI